MIFYRSDPCCHIFILTCNAFFITITDTDNEVAISQNFFLRHFHWKQNKLGRLPHSLQPSTTGYTYKSGTPEKEDSDLSLRQWTRLKRLARGERSSLFVSTVSNEEKCFKRLPSRLQIYVPRRLMLQRLQWGQCLRELFQNKLEWCDATLIGTKVTAQ